MGGGTDDVQQVSARGFDAGRRPAKPGVLASLLRRVRLPEQALLSRGPLDVLDHASPQAGLGGKMAVDLTGVSPEDVPAEIRLPDRWEFCCGVTSVDCSLAEIWGALVLFAGRSAEVDAERFVLRNEVQGVSWVVVMERRRRGVSVFRPAVAGRGGLRSVARRAAERRYGFFRREDQGRRGRGIRPSLAECGGILSRDDRPGRRPVGRV